MAAFGGWPRDALRFLRYLEDNNDRDWFKANRARYDEHLVAPSQLLAEDLRRKHGDARFFRPYRDTRFHPGPPIKELISFTLGNIGAGGGYVELSLDGVFVGAGVYHPMADQIERFRAAIDDGRRGAAFDRAARRAIEAGLELPDPDLKRAPRGWPADHPRIDHLRRKRFIVYHREKLGPWVHTPEAGARIGAWLDAATPLVRWFREHVGPTQQQRR
jgi:uncharacterized protein (TIGR02453 family)